MLVDADDFSAVLVGEKLQSGYGPELSLFPKEADAEPWQMIFAKPQRELLPLKEEAIRQAQNLSKQYNNSELNIFYSGGIDSEFLIHIFREAQVKFRVLTFRFDGGLNGHDLSYVLNFQKKNPDLKMTMLNFNLLDFFHSGEYMEYALQSRCVLPHLLSLMKMVYENRAQPSVLGAGEPFLLPHRGEWCLRERESVAGLNRFFLKNKIAGTPAFFQESSELFFSYLGDPIFQQLARGERVGKEHSLTSRIDIYSRHYPISERTKYHGYEKVEELMLSCEKSLLQNLPHSNTKRYYRYNQLLKLVQDQHGS